MSNTVSLVNYAEAFQQIIPGAQLRAGRHGVQAEWHVRITHEYDRAVNAEHAEALLTQLAEQMRIRAIRELGLEPILEAQRAEVHAFQQANKQLQATCDARASRIADLEERLAFLEGGDD